MGYLTIDYSSFPWPKTGYVVARSTGRAATTLPNAVLQPSPVTQNMNVTLQYVRMQ